MNNKYNLVLVALISALSGALVAEAAAPQQWVANYRTQRADSKAMREMGNYSNELVQANKFANVLQSAVGDEAKSKIIAANATTSSAEPGETSAMLLLQNQKMIEQNDQIIALLKARK